VIKTTLSGCALAVALSAGPAIAADFHALAGLQGATPAPLQDGVLAATEGGASCSIGADVTADSGATGGVCLIALLPPAAAFAVTNELPVTAAQFLQVHGFAAGTFPGAPPAE
jgi:hypothetical protein